ncbi:MAG: aspartyl/glutamyl-tRNA amidotransferase subunit C [Clostridiales bacterium]|nr:aspartyl/glutamyl-tRNA amidotransferase subunit C [Clostridiales bacterium]
MITAEEIKKIAELAKFSLENENIEELAADIGRIIEFADEISGADMSGMDAAEEDDVVALREDIVAPSLPVEKALLNAKESHGGYFVARD